MRHAAGEEDRVDLLLNVAGEQEPPVADFAEQHDRDVVHAGAGVGRFTGNGHPIRPQHAKSHLVEREAVAGRQQPRRRAISVESRGPCRVARSRAAHARLEDAPDPVPPQQHRESGHVVLVRMGQHDGVDAPVPRRDVLVQRDEQPVGIRAAVDEQPAAPRALDEDRVALTHVEDRDARSAVGPVEDDDDRSRHRNSDGHERDPLGPRQPKSCAARFRDGGRVGGRFRPTVESHTKNQ